MLVEIRGSDGDNGIGLNHGGGGSGKLTNTRNSNKLDGHLVAPIGGV